MLCRKISHDSLLTLSILFVALVFFASDAWAFTAPTAASKGLGYEVYDVVYNKVFKGPIGYTAGFGMLAISIMQFAKNWVMSLLGIVSSTLWINADGILTALGAML